MTARSLDLSRDQILAFRRRVQALDERLPPGATSLRQAAWAGLQDSMPRAALLSIHARVDGTQPSTWEEPALVQVWGPRFGAYVVAREDVAPFTLGRFPADDVRGRQVATDTADRLEAFLDGRRLTYDEAGRGMGVPPNSLRYATTTGRVLIRWAGARAPMIWTVPAPDISAADARLELARRYLHLFAPTSPDSFARWAGIGAAQGRAAFEALAQSLVPASTPIGDGWILASDEPALRAAPGPPAPARLVPSGDTFYLLWGADRDLLVPDAKRRDELWTSRVWPGAVLAGGNVVGTWRRDAATVSIQAWRRLAALEREAIEAEATSLPLPDLRGPIRVRWEA